MFQTITDKSNIVHSQSVSLVKKKKVIAAIRPKSQPERTKRNIQLTKIIDVDCYQFPFTEELLRARSGVKEKVKSILQDKLQTPLGYCKETREAFSKQFKEHQWIFDSIENRKLVFRINFPMLAKLPPNEVKPLVTCTEMTVAESVNLMPKTLARRFRELPKQNISPIAVRTCISMYRNVKLQEFLEANDLFFRLLYNSMIEALELKKKGY